MTQTTAPVPSSHPVMAADHDAMDWQRDYWNAASRLEGLRPVLDPSDRDGLKNAMLDRVHGKHVCRFLRRNRIGPVHCVLDYGCGVGRHYALLSALAERYVGVEISAGMAERAPGDVRLIDGTTLPFDDRTFDLVWSFWVLQHVVEDDLLHEVISEFRRTITGDGVVVICERSAHTRTEPGRPDEYIRHRAPEEYISAFRSGGFALRSLRKITYRRSWRSVLRRSLRTGENLYAFAPS